MSTINGETARTRAEAVALGLNNFTTGRPCGRGHIDKRSTASGNCLACQRIHNAKHYAKKDAVSREKRRARALESNRNYLARNSDDVNARRWRRYEENAVKMRKQRKEWANANPAAILASNALMRAKRMNCVPPWLNAEDRREIAAIYAARDYITAQTGVTHHVDHIEPLNGKVACGLHVPWNLRVIPANDNLKKGNRRAIL